jgi:hypothetical protein
MFDGIRTAFWPKIAQNACQDDLPDFLVFSVEKAENTVIKVIKPK